VNYKTVTTSVLLQDRIIRDMEFNSDTYLRAMLGQMARALAEEIVKSNIGEIDEEYDILNQAKRYTMSIRIAER